MCVTIRREYRLAQLRPGGVSKFAGAALLNVLSPMDWQIANDVEHLAFQTIRTLREVVGPQATAVVEVTIHSTHIELAVSSDDPSWVTEVSRLRPRRLFRSELECELEAPPAQAPKPALWPALAEPRTEESWSATYEALSEVTQSLRFGVIDLVATLDAIAAGVVKATPFTAAAVNLVNGDGDFEVVAVQGPAEMRRTLLGVVEPAEYWNELIKSGREWGTLRYLPHDDPLPSNDLMTTYVPELDCGDGPEFWHPEDALIAPLYASDGACIGAISVDLPLDARAPGIADLERLELFADHAALAIERARTGNLT